MSSVHSIDVAAIESDFSGSYVIAPDVYVCVTADGSVVLDLNRDKYLGMSREQTELLAMAVPGWPQPIWERLPESQCPRRKSDPDAVGNADAVCRGLVNEGLLIQSVVDEGAVAVGDEVGAGRACRNMRGEWISIGDEMEVGSVVGFGDVVNFASAFVWARCSLAWRPFIATVGAVKARKAALNLELDWNPLRVAAMIDVFRRLRPYVFAAEGRCLLHALTLVRFLSQYGFYPEWVIGVATQPWGAHSWVQWERFLLDTNPEKVCATRRFWWCSERTGGLVFRYVILLWNEQLAGLAARAQALAGRLCAKSTQWRDVINGDGWRVLVAGVAPPFDACVLSRGGNGGAVGVVLGEIYRRGAVQKPAVLGSGEAAQIQDTHGRTLASAYWGNYVALIEDAGCRLRFVFKDPCGTLPCYFTKHQGVQVVFSCVGDCQDVGLALSVNGDFVRARAVNGFLDFDIPSLVGVSSVHRGECVEFDRDAECASRAVYWHPASFEGAGELIVEPELAAQALRETVGDCVNSMAVSHSRVVAQISGGLDSSIVLGCLAEAPNKPDITCYTDYVRESVCDERRWARYATQRKNLRHVEVAREPKSLRYQELPALAASMEPASYFPHYLRGPLNRSLAKEYGATAVFTGEGGDACLCSTSYVFAVNHALRRYGVGRRTLRTAAMVARRRDRTIWRVLAKAVGGEVFGVGTGGYRRQLATVCRLVSSDVRKALETESGASSSWLGARGPVTQESLLRLGTLAFPPTFYDLSTQPEVEAPVSMSPLCMQPVFEVCMRIPVDVHFDGGRVRGLARRAFADLLPEPILRRQWKDRPLSMVAGVIQHNLKFVRETLMEGYLMREKILDRRAVELALQNGPTSSAVLSGEVLSHLDLELWIRNFA